MNVKRNRMRAFTLIELLVVVAILALLIAILLPALRGAREQGKQTICLTNMKTMGEATHYYAQDNREFVIRSESPNHYFMIMLLPFIGQPDARQRMFSPNGTLIRPVLKEICAATSILNCPSFPDPADSPDEVQILDYVVSGYPIPYPFRPSDSISDVVGPGPRASGDTRREEFTNLGKFGRLPPSMFIFITEAHMNMPPPNNRIWSELTDLFVPEHLPLASWPRVANDQRHPRGITAMYFDGRADVQAIRKIDPGAGYTLRDRMRKFTYDEDEPR
jgi:prepilin-type N-terminal cleavage/methylation domain-containing protein